MKKFFCIMSHLQTHNDFKPNIQKMWTNIQEAIHGTKPPKDNQLQNAGLPYRIS